MITFKETIRYCAVAAAIALLPASCCRPNISISQEESEESRPIPIMIGAASTGTKAVIESTGQLGLDAYNSSKGFGVYGYKYNSNNTNNPYTLLFNNMEVKAVKPDENEATVNTAWTWTYSPTRYWDSNPLVSYQFIAYWPKLPSQSGSGPYVSESERVLTIHDIPNWQAANPTDNCTDYLTATEKGRYIKDNQEYSPFSDDYVKFNFNHLLSKLEIWAYYIGVEANVVKVNSITINGNNIPVYGQNSNYTEPFDGQGSASYSTPRGNTTPSLYDKGQAAQGFSLEGTYYDEDPEKTITPIKISQWLIVPSTGWGNIKLNTNYSIGSATYTSESTGITFDSGEDNPSEMLPGKTYILTLKYDSSGGGLDVHTVWVNDWNVQTPVSHKVYNW